MTIIKADFGRNKDSSLQKSKEDEPISRYQLHVSLAFSDPLIWRRIVVPGEMTLYQLHRALQVCFGWAGEHGHQFYVGKVFYAMDTAHADPRFNEALVELYTLEEAMRWCFTYMYDAGDGWEHTLELEEILTPGSSKKPVILDGEWAAPPEQVGGVHDYTEIIEALDNPQHEGSRRLLQEQNLVDFDPYRFDMTEMNKMLAKQLEFI